MQNYYTVSHFNTDVGYRLEFDRRDVRALLFFGSGARPELFSVLDAAKTLLGAETLPWLARRDGTAWAVTPWILYPKADRWHEDFLFIENLDTDPVSISSADLYRFCSRTEAFTGACPCSANREWEIPGVLTACQKEVILPHVPDVPLARLKVGRGVEFPKKYPKVVGEFEYRSPRSLGAYPFAENAVRMVDIDMRPEALARSLKTYRQQIVDGVRTRNRRRTMCSVCVFTDGCLSYGVNTCEGPRTDADVWEDLRGVARHYDVFRAAEQCGFTKKQIAFLVRLAAIEQTFEGDVPTFSSRKTRVSLGYFDQDGAFCVFAGAQARDRSTEFSTWESLIKAIPELLRLEKLDNGPLLPAWVQEAYSILATKRWIRVRTAFAAVSHSLLRIAWDGFSVAAYYGGRKGARYSSIRLSKDYRPVQLYDFINGAKQGYNTRHFGGSRWRVSSHG